MGKSAYGDGCLTIQPVMEENMRDVLALAVAPAQQRHIETTRECLQEAAQTDRWKPVGLYADGVLVGFAMYGSFPQWIGEGNAEQVWLDRLLIDARYQGMGYGKAALKHLLHLLESAYGCDRIYLSVYGDNEGAITLYQAHGFEFTGELDTKGEKVMCRVKP